MKKKYLKVYEFDTDIKRINFHVVHDWLSKSYWSPKISIREIKNCALNSTLVVGCFCEKEQIGYMRLVSDRFRFAYLMDVFIEEDYRGKGIAQNMIKFSMSNKKFKNVYQWVLATKDAHSLYKKIGFEGLPFPDRWMILRKDKKWP